MRSKDQILLENLYSSKVLNEENVRDRIYPLVNELEEWLGDVQDSWEKFESIYDNYQENQYNLGGKSKQIMQNNILKIFKNIKNSFNTNQSAKNIISVFEQNPDAIDMGDINRYLYDALINFAKTEPSERNIHPDDIQDRDFVDAFEDLQKSVYYFTEGV